MFLQPAQWLEIEENGIHILIEITEDQDVRLLYIGTHAYPEVKQWSEKKRAKFRMVEIQASGENHDDHHGSKHTGTLPAKRLRLQHIEDMPTDKGRKLVFQMIDVKTDLEVEVHIQFYNQIPVIRCWTTIANKGNQSVGLEYVSSFAYTGLLPGGKQPRDQRYQLSIPHNTWYGEVQWQHYTLAQLGLHHVNEFSMKRLSYQSTGTWSSSQYLPLAYIENKETGSGLAWQIEHNGSWHWEISDMVDMLYIQASGPTEQEHQWWKNLQPGMSFTSVPVSVALSEKGIDQALAILTDYRRVIRRPNKDNQQLPVIFNDYMNCLFGEPTTEALLPLIDAAAEIGCEYYCIDCGWYSDGYWWDGVGEWLPSQARFPNGIEEVLAYIRQKGMVPGLWLELEVMGVACELADQVPAKWFFTRHGHRVIDHARYQLDFRHPGVIEHANRVINRLVNEYKVGYIKMDYNINAGVGTEWQADSFGDGLLQHNQAYLKWLDQIWLQYPDLVIENCGSGGLRMDYALLSRHSIQSTSDQTDYRKNAVIAAASASAVTPEQAAVWSYPLRDGHSEEVIMNMVNTLLLRVHQSGHIAEIQADHIAFIREAITYYKTIRQQLAQGQPFWPLGLPSFGDDWLAFAMNCDKVIYLAVWRMTGEPVQSIPLSDWTNKQLNIKQAYPAVQDSTFEWNPITGLLSIELPSAYSARLYEIHGI